MNDNRHQDGIYPFPAGMQSREIETNGAKIHVRVGGHGPAVVMLHGFGTTGDMWGHLASALIEDHMVVAPDLRGLGLSSKPDGGYDKKNQAADVVGVLDALGVRTAELVTHDIDIMVGFAVAATHPERVSRWVAIDAPLPGVGPWDQITQDPAMWHFGFGGQDMERLVAGRERIYLDRFWNELSRDPKRFDEAKRQHYAALYAQPGAMRAGFAQFLAFSQDAADNRKFLAQGKLQMPVLAFGKIPYQERFRRQRRDLLDAAAGLAAEHGVAGTSVASITTAAGLAKRVFYDHFADKEACFVELFREFGAERLRAALNTAEAAGDPSAFGIVRSVIRSLVTYRASDPRLVAAIRAEARPGSPLAAAYDEQHRQIADLLVVVALRLGSSLPEQTIRLAALLLVNGVVDLAAELRERQDALNELSTIVCLAFGLPAE